MLIPIIFRTLVSYLLIICLFQVVFWMDAFPLWTSAFGTDFSFILLFNVNISPTTWFFFCFHWSFLCFCMVGIWGWCSAAFWTLSPHVALLYSLSLHSNTCDHVATLQRVFQEQPSWFMLPLSLCPDILIFLWCECQVDTRDMVTLISPKHSFLLLLISLWLVSLV